MAKITFEGLDEYMKEFDGMLKRVPSIVNASLYDGAGIVADAVQAEIKDLTELTPEARKGLSEGLGVAHFWQENGATVTKIGFEGYNSKRTKRWPRGQPNAMIALSLIRGTSWMRANRFVQRATKKARQGCVEAMKKRLDAEFQKLPISK